MTAAASFIHNFSDDWLQVGLNYCRYANARSTPLSTFDPGLVKRFFGANILRDIDCIRSLGALPCFTRSEPFRWELSAELAVHPFTVMRQP